jgi:putative transposase
VPAARLHRGLTPYEKLRAFGTEGTSPPSPSDIASSVVRVPRPLRVQFPGAVYHVTSRAVAKLPLFRAPADPRVFLGVLDAVVFARGWACYAYCLMTTHYHLLIRTPRGDLANGMQQLNSRYARAFNRRHAGAGHVFFRRYAAQLVERDAHLLETCRYIALNPVRAGLTAAPGEWPWSSYAAVVGLAPRPRLLAADWLLGCFGSDRERAVGELRAFVEG